MLHFTIIGWDIIVDDNEKIQIIEWNGEACDIKFSEATTGPCFLGLHWEKYRENQEASRLFQRTPSAHGGEAIESGTTASGFSLAVRPPLI